MAPLIRRCAAPSPRERGEGTEGDRMKLTDRVINPAVQERNPEALAKAGVVLPKFSELADPLAIDPSIGSELQRVGFDEPHPLNLFRVHWHNTRRERAFARVPEHVVLPSSLTGVDAKIVVLLGNRFPMIRAHKVWPRTLAW